MIRPRQPKTFGKAFHTTCPELEADCVYRRLGEPRRFFARNPRSRVVALQPRTCVWKQGNQGAREDPNQPVSSMTQLTLYGGALHLCTSRVIAVTTHAGCLPRIRSPWRLHQFGRVGCWAAIFHDAINRSVLRSPTSAPKNTPRVDYEHPRLESTTSPLSSCRELG